MPTPGVQFVQLAFADLIRIEHGGHEYAFADLDFAHGDLVWEVLVLLLAHPVRTRHGLGPGHHLIASAERLTATKIRNPRSVLGEQHIHTGSHLCRDQKVVTVKRIPEQDVAAN